MPVEVKAPMQGDILEILVKPGDSVETDDELIIMEAMKIENPIYSPSGGTVSEILVKEKDSVEAEQTLLILE